MQASNQLWLGSTRSTDEDKEKDKYEHKYRYQKYKKARKIFKWKFWFSKISKMNIFHGDSKSRWQIPRGFKF